ncbi:MAG: methyl-accepting chemotaxis protein [Gammaproteobacteria bacterium]|nr:methyl-accepting chemotaxis protein [Sideroxydans sp.]MBU4150195.1 methyl-accepting chemotaxis protein [Gammaproteobacteria bacterium]
MQNKNAYVSQKEVTFPDGEVLISKTDTKGIITYCNDAFERLSGYSRNELIGKSHNIVRHPDMPKQAFKWLWDTLKTERPWRGLVKNRCKNGDHYWVRATVAPILEGGSLIGYVSVRRPPTRAQIAKAESVYRALNQNGGEVVSRYERLKVKNWSLKTKLQAAIQIPLLLILTVAQIYLTGSMQEEAKLQAESKGAQIATQIIDNANMLMVTGQIGIEENRKLLIEKVTSSGHVQSAVILRSDHLIDQYGAGTPEQKARDDVQREVLKSGKAKVSYGEDSAGSPVLRVVTPYLASKDFHGTDCTLCHAGPDNWVTGASDISIDLKDDFDRIHLMEMKVLAGQIVLQLFLFFFIGYCVDRFIHRPLSQVEKEFRNIMEGNLDTELDITIQDEMGKLLCAIQTMQTYLRTMVDEIVTPVVKMRDKVKSVDEKVGVVASNAVTEQAQIQSIAATMEQFSQSIAEVANMASDSLTEMKRTQGIVEQNNANMGLSIDATTKVAETVQRSSKTISDLGASIERIGKIANSIKEIADQTNLLALNAAIEAARAGEQGRGFAVVADEVRKLAERTASSTKDITKTIADITAISEEAVKSMGEAVVEVESGITLIRSNGERLQEVMEATVSMSQRIDHITMASKEQSVAGENVAKSLEHISGLVDENARSSQQTRDAAVELAKSADELSKAGYPLTKCGMRNQG